MELENLTIEKAHQGLLKKEFSAQELTKHYFQKIEEEDKKIHSYLNLYQDLAILEAKETDEMISRERKLIYWQGFRRPLKTILWLRTLNARPVQRFLKIMLLPTTRR